MDHVYDLTIIGGGPTGLYAAFYAGLRQMKTKVIDSLPQLGGQLSALYPEKYIYDVAGFAKVLSKDLVQMLAEQATQYEPTICLDEKVHTLQQNGDGVPMTITTDRATHHTKTVVLAAGMGAFMPKKLDLPRIDEMVGRGVQYFVADTSGLVGRRLVIVGGGDSALDWALGLHPQAAACTLVHRSDRFRAHEDSVAKLMESPVDVRTFHELKEIHGDEHVEAVTIFDNRTGEETLIPCDNLLLNLGFLTNLGPIKEWGLTLEKNKVTVSTTMQTNLPGVYAAGDICTYPGKLLLIATGFGEAAIAVNYAKTYIDPAAKAFPGHSSDLK